MADNVELEEAEACSDDDGGSFVDLDVALAYIGEKLQHVLGHHQKDFDGGVSAENLGLKFGGYGSFLHTYQRSATPSPQTRSPTKVANISTSRSPYQQSAEDPSQLFIRLTAEEDNEVHECLDGRGSSSEVLVLHESSNIEVTREKFRCLRPHGWLNDEEHMEYFRKRTAKEILRLRAD